jgi:hypothetical protein
MGKMYRAGPEWKMVGEGAAPPAGTSLVDVQSTTLADAYVVRGKGAGGPALAARGKALEIHPLADPTTIGAGEAFPIEILYQGKPLAGARVSLFREAGLYDGRKVVGEFGADQAGRHRARCRTLSAARPPPRCRARRRRRSLLQLHGDDRVRGDVRRAK